MKEQYFGDTRDLFKFDLIQHILVNLNLTEFIYIPMLTKDEDDYHWQQRDYDDAIGGINNKKLIQFFKNIQLKEKYKIIKISQYFSSIGITTNIHKFQDHPYFSNKNRSDYFNIIKKNILSNSFIFFDPDNGLEPQSSCKENHLKYLELKSIVDTASNSLFMVYQHSDRSKKETMLSNKFHNLKQININKLFYITDGVIYFFIFSNSSKINSLILSILEKYRSDYPNLNIGELS